MESDWNPDLYLKFRNERTQPSIDLVNRINLTHSPENILDIGCGPGNSSQIVLQRWPRSKLRGVDHSPNMIEKANKDFPDQEWILADAAHYEPGTTFDVVFSNATIQWIPNHRDLIYRFCSFLSENGALAVQLPKFHDMPLAKAIDCVAHRGRWKSRTGDCSSLFTYHDHRFYYDVLASRLRLIDIWETDYIHIMPSHSSIVEWIRSTGMKPYLDRLTDENEKHDFEQEVLGFIRSDYPLQPNGRVLFSFKRMFFIGYK